MKKSKKIIIIILAVIIAIILALVGTFFILTHIGKLQFHDGDTHISTDAVEIEDENTIIYNNKKYTLNKNIVSVLVMGIDRDNVNENYGSGNNGQADVIFLATIDTKTKKTCIIPLSRETMVDVNLYTSDGKFAGTKREQLCLAYAYGNTTEDSCQNVLTSAKRLLYGININSYMAIEMKGVSKLTDLIGGVELTCLEDSTDSKYFFKKGEKLNLKGEKAIAYIQYRGDDTEAKDGVCEIEVLAQEGKAIAVGVCSTPLPPSPAAPLPHDVAMGSFPRQGQRMCGDSVTFFREGESRLFLLLSDGMGSGREARRESQLTVRLLEQFLTAGIDPKSALRTLNGALNLRSEDRGCFTTIDLADVDLTTGCARLYTYGAAPTYIKRMGSVRRLTGSSLPAGLQDTACVPAAIEIPLEENTFLLMISDGVADAGDDGWLQDLLAGWQGEDPHVLASQVLRLCRQRREADDDCSVLCLYLPRRGGGRREV